jgi:uncharacterized protein YcbK (DUF882 family)
MDAGELGTTPAGISRRQFLGGLAAFGGTLLVAPGRALASSRGERHLSLVNTHTSERLSVAYWGDGEYLPGELARVEAFLRDFRTGERHAIDPALLDQLHELSLGGGQARHSLHMQGRAIDVRLAGVSTQILRDAALELRRGGVGYYRGPDFVHVDTGPVRRW